MVTHQKEVDAKEVQKLESKCRKWKAGITTKAL
jgi:hypothetical protein